MDATRKMTTKALRTGPTWLIMKAMVTTTTTTTTRTKLNYGIGIRGHTPREPPCKHARLNVSQG